jgi:hypothetical protein
VPAILHETILDIFRHRPSLAAEFLASALGVELPAYREARLEPGDLTDLAPTEYRADQAVVLADDGGPVLAVVVEVQMRGDPDKRWTWPVYLTTLRSRLHCPTVLLVVCVEPATARWCAAPIALGHPDFELTPLVLGPDRFPVVTDAVEAARSPEVAVLSAIAHGGRPECTAVLDALVSALESIDDQQATLYADVVLATLPLAARRHMEELMRTGVREYQSEFARKYFSEGHAEGHAESRAEDVLAVLDARGIDVPEADRVRIGGCRDLDQLGRWLRRAATAESVTDLD